MRIPKALLIDIDGVLRIASQPIPGAPEALHALRRLGIPYRFLTNVTMDSRADVAGLLTRIGIPAEPGEVYTAAYLAAEFLRRQASGPCWVLLEGSAHAEFAGLPHSENAPEWVVLGDVGYGMDARLMTRAFRALLAGARLLAVQHNAAWRADDGPRLDVGAWAAALEYASGQKAVVAGKPSPLAFHLPAAELGLAPSQVAMVADDPDVDLAGAAAAGLQTIFVRTTSLPRRRAVDSAEFDLQLDAFADLPTWLSAYAGAAECGDG